MLLAGLAIIAAADCCAAATVRRAWIEHRGRVYTIHLEVGGRPRWVLGQQDNRLQIDLLNTTSNLSSRQFLQAAIGPLGAVRISGAPQQRLRVEISASGKCDFLVGRKHNQLIVSLAPGRRQRGPGGGFHPGARRPTGPSSGARRDRGEAGNRRPCKSAKHRWQAPRPSVTPYLRLPRRSRRWRSGQVRRGRQSWWTRGMAATTPAPARRTACWKRTWRFRSRAGSPRRLTGLGSTLS